MSVDNQHDEYNNYRAFLDRIPKIRLMVRDFAKSSSYSRTARHSQKAKHIKLCSW
jgi:hypothetical protein